MDVKKLASELKLLATEKFSEATARSINRVAQASHSQSLINVRSMFTIRNKFTQGSMMFFKATPKSDANRINAITGSKSPYMDEQEAGGTAKTQRGQELKSMPSMAARRGNWGRAVTARYRKSALGAVGHRGAGGRMTPNGAKFFWLSGGQLKKPMLFERRGSKLIRVRVAATGPIHLKATHWHSKAVAKHGRPEVMSAAWGRELSIELAKLGAK